MADPALEPLVHATTDEQKRAAIETIIARAEAVIRRVLGRKLRPGDEDAAEIRSEVVLALVARLQDISTGEAEPLLSFDDYTASVTLHAFNNVMRRRYPQRARLKSRVRYLLTHDARFALWTTRSDEAACGFTAWSGSASADDAEAILDWHGLPVAARDSRHPADALAAVFREAGRPLELESVVNLLARLWDVRELIEFMPRVNAVETGYATTEKTAASSTIEARQFVLSLWREITALNPRQRAAILWHLRDSAGRSALPLILISGAATLEEIAEALSTQPSELLAVWPELPFDDRRIASLLGLTRQQIINLRKSARERLSRRMKHFK